MLPIALVLLLAAPSTHLDSRGAGVRLPLGDVSFADEVVSFKPGKGGEAEPKGALGPPGKDKQPALLGCQGVLTLRFTDNALVDVPGPDLFVFASADAASTFVSVSKNGELFQEAGRVTGATGALDVAKLGADRFPWVRLTDKGSRCGANGVTGGIDAVAAIGSALKLTLASAALFGGGGAALQPTAAARLDEVAAAIEAVPGGQVEINAYVDSSGTFAQQQALTKAQAEAVREALAQRGSKAPIKTVGRANSWAVGSNQTEEGREKNRRVEIFVRPAR